MDVERMTTVLAPPPQPISHSGDNMAAQVAAPAPAPVPVQPHVSVEAETQRGENQYAPPGGLQRAVSSVNTALKPHGRHLSISVHEATGRNVIKVFDTVTDEVIREIPPERVLDAHASLLEMAGLFYDRRG